MNILNTVDIKNISIVGQKSLFNNIKVQMQKDIIGHAYVLNGRSGMGKKVIAREFAKVLLCTDIIKPCNTCTSCKTFNEGTCPDYYEVSSEKSTISIEQIRDLQKTVYTRPVYGERKVYVIFDADKMTVQAQNCLLKTLEEPPVSTTIIMTTSSYNSMLETIRSRVIRMSIDPYPLDEIAEILKRNTDNMYNDIEFLFEYSDGVPRKALDFVNNEKYKELRDKAFELVFEISQGYNDRLFIIQDYFANEKDYILDILNMLKFIYVDILKVTCNMQKRLINLDKKDIIISNAYRFKRTNIIKNLKSVLMNY